MEISKIEEDVEGSEGKPGKNKQQKVAVVGNTTFEDLSRTVPGNTRIVDVGNLGADAGGPVSHPNMESERKKRTPVRTVFPPKPSGSGGSQAPQGSPDQK